MGIAERKEKERLARRNDVIEAAEALFREKGFDHTTMDNIAKDTGFTKKTIYTFFSSKDEIYMEIMIRGFNALNKMIDFKLDSGHGESSIKNVEHLGLAFVDFSMNYPYYYKAITDYENKEFDFKQSNQSKLIENCYIAGQYSMERLQTFINEGVLNNEIISNVDPKIIALVLWSSMTGLINLVGRKEKYVAAYFNENTDVVLKEGLKLILNSIEYKML
jgi:AcrR family transcriptional regulator